MIKRNFSDRTKENISPLRKKISKTSRCNTCSQIWSPHYARDIKLINGVQRRSTKLVESVKDFFIGVAVLLLSL